MSLRLNRIIRINKSNFPVREATQLHVGFEALSTCDGKTYSHFRSLAGGSKGSLGRRFSPSTVWRLAEADGFARFDDGAEVKLATTTLIDKNMTIGASSSSSDKAERGFAALNDVRQLIIAEQVSLDLPGIYAWKIADGGVYVGKYTRKSRPLSEYNKNVRRFLCGEPYRPQNPIGFRRIHLALAHAVKDGLGIELHILENCLPEALNIRERHWIATISYGGLNA